MKKIQSIFKIIFSIFIIITLTNQSPVEYKSNDKLRNFELDEVIDSTFKLKSFNGTWISDNEILYITSGYELKLYDVEKNQTILILDRNNMEELQATSATFSPDKTKLLIKYDMKTIFRHSTLTKCRVYELETSNAYDLGGGKHMQFCIWSPVDSSVAYVQNNDIYHYSNKNIEKRLTHDGVPGIIYNGAADWVYEEEVLRTDHALWFSPDGTKLAYATFNDTNVKEYFYHIYGEPGDKNYQYPKEISLRYPKVNTTNPSVKLSVIDLTKSRIVRKHLPIPDEYLGKDIILGGVEWSDNESILVQWLNRRQNHLMVLNCPLSELVCNVITTQQEPNGWINISPFKCYPKINKCFYIREREWRNIESIDIPTSISYPETLGNRTVLELIGYDTKRQTIYYASTTETNPEFRHIYKGDHCISCHIKSPEDENCNYSTAKFSEDFTYIALTCLGPSPAFTKIYKTDTNEEILTWEDNIEPRTKLLNYQNMNIKYLRIPVVDGRYFAAVKLFLPKEIDINNTKIKYPMIVNVYNGPNSVRVLSSFSVKYENYLVTNRKVIYCFIDGRGSGNKGKSMAFEMNNKFGVVEVDDQIEVTKFLQNKFQFIDAERTGIWGWSYGGYVTGMTLLKDKERVFQCGISVAPVTSWILYDSIYTERYMGLPIESDNLIGYNNSDISQHVDKMRNHDFMLIHGNADDNVHYQHSMILSRALQKAEILFQQMSYPDEAHSLNGVSPHLYKTMDDFWTNCLNIGGEEY